MAVTTGIEKLDSMIGGGFPEGTSALIEGAPGTGKEEIAMQFLFVNIKSSKGYYMFYGPNVSQIVKKFSQLGMDISKSKNITWVDTNNMSKGENVVSCKLEDLTTLALAMSEFYEKNRGKKIAGVVAVLSPSLMTNDPVIIYRFLYDMVQKLKKYDATAMFLIEEGMHREDTIVAMEGLCDFIMQTKFIDMEGKPCRALRIKKSVGPSSPDFHCIEITPKGVVMVK